MLNWLAGLFLVAHGLVHLAIWLPTPPKDVPFDVHHSPMFGDVRGVAVALAVLAAGGFVVSGIAYLAGQDRSGLVGASGVGIRCRVDRPDHPHVYAVVAAGVGDRRDDRGVGVAVNP